MFSSRNHGTIACGLLLAVILWGGNNAGIKYLVKEWPPIWIAATRSLFAGLLLFAILRWTPWLGKLEPLSAATRRQLWWRTGLALAIYVVVFTWALRLTAVSHVALYLGASPVWALMWEGGRGLDRRALVKRYLAAALALAGVLVLFGPALGSSGRVQWLGELLGLAASVLWTFYGRQSRLLGAELSGAALTGHTMWRAGLLLLPFAALEAMTCGVPLRPALIGVQAYCTIAGGVIAFALWSNALRHWQTSKVYLFNNLIPLSTVLWAHFTLGEPVSPTFWTAMGLIVAGVVLGQTNWERALGFRWSPPE